MTPAWHVRRSGKPLRFPSLMPIPDGGSAQLGQQLGGKCGGSSTGRQIAL